MIWILFLVATGGVIAYFVSSYRKKVAEREAASKKRFEEMFLAQGKSAPPSDMPPVPAPSAAPPAARTPPVAKTPTVAVAALPVRERFLDQRETLLYRLLKVSIPDHEIFANVSLATVAGGRNEQELRHLAPYQLDFVVCDKNMRVVAAVEFEPAGGSQAIGDLHFKAEYLKTAGINLVRINPAALPRRDEIRGLVCGQLKSAT